MSNTSSGIVSLVIAGITNASFTTPMKYARKCAWENMWFAWTILALVVLPLAAAVATIPNLSMVYRSATPHIILEVCGFGAGWGVAQVSFGLAVDMIGVILAFSIVLGTSAALGSLIPMVSLYREHVNSTAGYAVLGAIGRSGSLIWYKPAHPALWTGSWPTGILGAGSRVALIHVADRDHRDDSGHVSGRMERLRASSHPHPVDRCDRTRASDFCPGRLSLLLAVTL